MAYINGRFAGLMSTAEAAAIWGREESTVRKAILRGLFTGESAKFGKQWVVTAEGMRAWTGTMSPWLQYQADQADKPRDNEDPNQLTLNLTTPPTGTQ